MTGVYLIGAGKFACQVARYVRDVAHAGTVDWIVRGFVATDAGPPFVPADLVVEPDGFTPLSGVPVLLAMSDIDERRKAVARFPDAVFVNLVHPTSNVDGGQLVGKGNVVGPYCAIGADATVDSFNVVTNHSSVGNHAHIGSNNFLSPSFHCGNSVEIGDDNFFGLSCTVAPGVRIGDHSVFGAGVTVFDDAGDRRAHISTARVKAMPRTTADS